MDSEGKRNRRNPCRGINPDAAWKEMTDETPHRALPRTLVLPSLLALGLWVYAPPAARGINNAQQILIGGGTTLGDSIAYSAPGLSIVFDTTKFAGSDANAAQIRMPVGGNITRMRLSVVTQNPPTIGTFFMRVLKNGSNTPMTCALPGTGSCSSTAAVSFNAGDRISLLIDNDFFGAGDIAFTHAFVID